MNFEKLYNEAVQAGRDAANAMTPRPMAVQSAMGFDDGFDYNRPYEVVADGVCGFAWLNIRPSSPAGQKDAPFVKWLRKQTRGERFSGYGHYEEYAKAWQIWIGDYNQSMARKEAHAEAMAKVLRDAGIQASAQSRMD